MSGMGGDNPPDRSRVLMFPRRPVPPPDDRELLADLARRGITIVHRVTSGDDPGPAPYYTTSYSDALDETRWVPNAIIEHCVVVAAHPAKTYRTRSWAEAVAAGRAMATFRGAAD